jgi:hypothetical protein
MKRVEILEKMKYGVIYPIEYITLFSKEIYKLSSEQIGRGYG